MAAGAEVRNGEAAEVEVKVTPAVKPSSPTATHTLNPADNDNSNVDVDANCKPNSDVIVSSDAKSDDGGLEESKIDPNSKPFECKNDSVADMLKKLNPMAKEFFPSSYNRDHMGMMNSFVMPSNKISENEAPNSTRRKNNYNQSRRRLNGRAVRGHKDNSIRRTVYVSDIDHTVTEERLAALFSVYGQVIDCRVCGDPHSPRLRFAFVEFADEYSAKAALGLCGAIVGYTQLKVLPSKTAILPVNPTFLPRSEDEREMCARTVYCTNIDKKVSQADVKMFFESRCGEVSQLRILGDQVHSTRIAFVEFVDAVSAILALDCCGQVLGSQPIRVSPSKTPVRPRTPTSPSHLDN